MRELNFIETHEISGGEPLAALVGLGYGIKLGCYALGALNVVGMLTVGVKQTLKYDLALVVGTGATMVTSVLSLPVGFSRGTSFTDSLSQAYNYFILGPQAGLALATS